MMEQALKQTVALPSIDRLGRPLRELRMSVIDRCNFRCSYCMPDEQYSWLPRRELLHFGEIGDLVFFKTRRRRAPVSHVGIYVGQNLFAHASTKHGVVISSLEHPYYKRTYVGARRLLSAPLPEAQASRE